MVIVQLFLCFCIERQDNDDYTNSEDELEDIVENTSLQDQQPAFKIDTYEPKRVVTAGIPIRKFGKLAKLQKDVLQPTTPRREDLGTARTARKFKNNGSLYYL